ncbi:DNA polymerase III subunit delta' [Candidatus Poribacteria bacterium]|nr:MAG: DNA polymerase III subunit delta' [Candidatus Poribacteria bacterium]
MLNDIIGHKKIVSQLQNAVKTERIAGAYIFSGIKGVGKETVAMYFARLILCENEDKRTIPCQACRGCRKIENGNHPDLRIIRPDGSQIKIGQIRELQQEIHYQPIDAERKIYIFINSERMNIEAANSLLKTLEEPPSVSTIVLLTENIESILPTIRSRCQVLPFYPLTEQELTESLIDRFAIDKQTASSIAILSGGVVGNAISLIEQDSIDEESVPEILFETDTLAAFRLAEEFEGNLESLDTLISWYRDLLFLQQEAPIELLTHTTAIEQLKTLVPRYSRIRLQQSIKTVFKTKEILKNTNVTKILALEVMCLQLLRDGSG